MEIITCSRCENEIEADSDYCPYCGNLLIENINCLNHGSNDAEGVCLICGEPYCNNCGGYVNGKFLCARHNHYEIYQGMAKVFGSSDYVQCSYIIEALKSEGITALMYNRKVSPLHLGGTDYSLFRASGDFEGHLINEVKVMVPFHQVLPAEKILNDLDIYKNGDKT